MKKFYLLTKTLLVTACLLLVGASSAWAAGEVFYVKFQNSSSVTQSTANYFTYDKGSGTAVNWSSNGKHSCTYGEETYDNVIKMESATQCYFTSGAEATITIVQTISNATGDKLKFDGTNLNSSMANTTVTVNSDNKYNEYVITKVAAGKHTITRQSETGLAYVKVEYTGSSMTQLSTPEISYNAATGAVTIGSVANATKVTYTTNGSDPTASSDTYSASFNVADGTVVKAIAIGDGESYSNSDVASETVYLTGITCATPVINSFNGTVAISSATPNATIKYSTDGGSSYNTYSRSFTVTSATTVQAYAQRESCTNSSETSKVVNVLPTNKTKTIYLAYGDFDNNTTNSATGKTGTDAEGYTLTITGNAEKKWSSNGVNITTPEGAKKEWKLSNGAENTLTIPTGVHVTKLTIYSVVNKAKASAAVSGWKEVGGVNYQDGGVKDYTNVPMGAFSDVADYNTNPDVRVYDINQTGGSVTFTNAGEQLFFVIGLDIFDASDENATIIPAYDKSTYVTPTKLDFSDVSGLKAYVATAAEEGSVTLSEVGAVPAGTPLMLIGTAGTEYTVPVAASASAPAKNMFVAGDGTTPFDGSSYDYILFSDGLFYKIGSGTVATNKAYLHCDSDPTVKSDPARGLRIVFDNITNVETVEAAAEAKAQDGKFIENGKLVIVKNGQKYNAAGAKLY